MIKLKFLLKQVGFLKCFCIHIKVNKYFFLNYYNFKYSYKLNLSNGLLLFNNLTEIFFINIFRMLFRV